MAVLIDNVLGVFKKWLYVEENYNIIAPMCAGIANFCPGEPDIIGVIGPSGSLKTEVIRSFGETQNDYVYPVSSLTDKTLVSGFRKSNDIVPRLKGRLLTIKDLTSILSKNEDMRAGIFADFRELTDGYIHKEFGNGVIKDYRDIHSSILFASTNGIEGYYSLHANLGQRIIFLRPQNDPKKARRRSVENRGKDKEMRLEIHNEVIGLVRWIAELIKEGLPLPYTSDEIREETGGFYDFLAVARTPLHRNYRGEIAALPEPEFPTRIANTVSRLCEVHAMVHDRDEVNSEDVDFAARIIRDNVPTMRWQVLKALSNEWMRTPEIKADKMSVGSVRYALDDLYTLGLAERKSREEYGGRSDSYRLTDWTVLQLERLRTRIRYNRDLEKYREEEDISIVPKFSTQSTEETEPDSCMQSAKSKDSGVPLKAIYKPMKEALEYANLGLNLYAGCSSSCGYCYNQGRFGGPCTQVIKKSALKNIEHDLKKLAEAGNRDRVHLSFIGDLYDLGREDNSHTQEVLELLRICNHPFQILTKGGTKAVQDFDLYGPNDRFGVTLTLDNPEDSKKFEPGAALPEDRIEALRIAHERGIKTWVSLEPVLDPDQTLHLIDLTHEFVDFYGVGKLNVKNTWPDKEIVQELRSLAESINWSKFRVDAEAKLKGYGKAYKIKQALLDVTTPTEQDCGSCLAAIKGNESIVPTEEIALESCM